MKRIIALAVALLAPLGLGAQDTARVETPDSVTVSEVAFHTQFFKARGEPAAKRGYLQWWEIFDEKKLGMDLGWQGYLYGESNFVSGTVGNYVDLLGGYLSLGFAVGGAYGLDEEGKASMYPLGAATLYTGTEKFYLDLYYEQSTGDRPGTRWARADLVIWSSDYFALGGLYQTGDGAGPRAELRIPLRRGADNPKRLDLRLWAAPTWNGGSRNLLLGGQLVGFLKEEIK